MPKFQTVDLPSRPKAFSFDVQPVANPVFEYSASTASGTIQIFDVIGGAVNVGSIAVALRQIGPKPVTIQINSPGGDYYEGAAIYNLLRAHGQKITAQVIGIAASAASKIVMAADRIEIARNAEIMIHEPWMRVSGNADAMAQAETWLRQLSTISAEVYAARTGQPVAKIREMMAAETFLSSGHALALGFADALLDRDADPKVQTLAETAPQSRRDLEAQMRAIGFSKAAATKVAAGGWPALSSETPDIDLAAIVRRLEENTRTLANLTKGSL